MTNKEAIDIIKELPDRIIDVIVPTDRYYDYKEALNIAIKALEKYETPQDECANCHEWDCFGCKVLKRQEADNEHGM